MQETDFRNNALVDFGRLFGRMPAEDAGLLQLCIAACGESADKIQLWFEKDNGDKIALPGTKVKAFRPMGNGYIISQHVGRLAGRHGYLLELPVQEFEGISRMVFECGSRTHIFPVSIGITQDRRAASLAITYDADEDTFSMETITESAKDVDGHRPLIFRYYVTDVDIARITGHGLILAEGQGNPITYSDTLETPGCPLYGTEDAGVLRGFPVPTAKCLARTAGRRAEDDKENGVLSDFERLYGRLPEEGTGLCLLDFGVFHQVETKQWEMQFHFEKTDGTKVEVGDVAFNHRYPNRWYNTASQRVGRKVSRCGCYLELPVGEFGEIAWLVIEAGWASCHIPVFFRLSSDKPVGEFGVTFSVRSRTISVRVVTQDKTGSYQVQDYGPELFQEGRVENGTTVFPGDAIVIPGSPMGQTDFGMPASQVALPMGVE